MVSEWRPVAHPAEAACTGLGPARRGRRAKGVNDLIARARLFGRDQARNAR